MASPLREINRDEYRALVRVHKYKRGNVHCGALEARGLIRPFASPDGKRWEVTARGFQKILDMKNQSSGNPKSKEG